MSIAEEFVLISKIIFFQEAAVFLTDSKWSQIQWNWVQFYELFYVNRFLIYFF